MTESFIDKKKRVDVLLTSLTYMGLVILSIFLVWKKGLPNLQDTYIINVGVDIFGMLVGYILFMCALIDIQKTGANHKNYLYLLNVAFLGLFCDLVSWLVDGDPSLRLINIIDNTIYYACMPIAAFFFWLYVRNVLRVESKMVNMVGKIMQWLLIVALISRIVNLKTGMFFSV